jgi:hypothetical protein
MYRNESTLIEGREERPRKNVGRIIKRKIKTYRVRVKEKKRRKKSINGKSETDRKCQS